jgi:hypothetical protein
MSTIGDLLENEARLSAERFDQLVARLDGLIARYDAINRGRSDFPQAVIRELDKIDPDGWWHAR